MTEPSPSDDQVRAWIDDAAVVNRFVYADRVRQLGRALLAERASIPAAQTKDV